MGAIDVGVDNVRRDGKHLVRDVSKRVETPSATLVKLCTKDWLFDYSLLNKLLDRGFLLRRGNSIYSMSVQKD